MMLKILFYVAVLILALFGYRHYSNSSSILKVGDNAPSFTLNDAQGQTHYLSDYAGHYLVLYFYPKDDTPGCTEEACQFRDDLHKLEKLGAKVVGISVDDGRSHAEFAEKYKLPFPLLSDENGSVAKQYNALTNLGFIKIAKRYTFLINPAGRLEKIYLNVNTSKHSQEIIDDLIKLKVAQ